MTQNRQQNMLQALEAVVERVKANELLTCEIWTQSETEETTSADGMSKRYRATGNIDVRIELSYRVK